MMFESKLEPSTSVVELESKLKSKLEPSTTFESKLIQARLTYASSTPLRTDLRLSSQSCFTEVEDNLGESYLSFGCRHNH